MNINGFLNINKPRGPTSHDIVRSLKRLLNVGARHKIGHTGTLDPPASGVLVIGIGQANRLAEYILMHPKEYKGIIRLGTLTDTLDADGETTETKEIPGFDKNVLDEITPAFTGDIMQVPPIVSALKKDGERYYVKARRGETEEPPARKVTVYALKLDKIDDETVGLYVQCSSGFYVRSLARDIARQIGTVGHLDELVRISVGPFKIEDAIDLDWIEQNGADAVFKNRMNPLDFPMDILPRIEIDGEEASLFKQGMKRHVAPPEDLPHNADIAVYSPDGFIGIGLLKHENDNLILKPRKVFGK